MLVSANSLIQSDLLSLNSILFIFNFPVHFYFIRQRQKTLSKPIFWCTTLITFYIQITAKSRLNKLLPLLLIFGCFRPMPLRDSLLAKRKFKRLLCRTTFLFHHVNLFLFEEYILSCSVVSGANHSEN